MEILLHALMLLLLNRRKTIRTSMLVILLVKIRSRSVNMTISLVNPLAKMDLVTKNASKRGKKVNFGWSLVIHTFY